MGYIGLAFLKGFLNFRCANGSCGGSGGTGVGLKDVVNV